MPSQSPPVISLVVAVAENGVIGRNGALPWRLSSDLKTFRAVTMGKPLIMGRRTYESLKGPLDGRDNIVVSRDPAFEAQGITVVDSVAAALVLGRALARTKGEDEVMVIGGAEVYQAALPQASRIYWTAVEAEPDGDTLFPEFDRENWHEVSRDVLPKGERDDYAAELRVLERKG